MKWVAIIFLGILLMMNISDVNRLFEEQAKIEAKIKILESNSAKVSKE